MINVLLIEDNKADVALIQSVLNNNRGNLNVTLIVSESITEALDYLREKDRIDLILTDLSLPDSCGPDTVELLQKYNKDAPIIVITGSDDEKTIEACMIKGAFTYLHKSDINGNVKRSIIAAHAKKNAEKLKNQKLVGTIKEFFPNFKAENI